MSEEKTVLEAESGDWKKEVEEAKKREANRGKPSESTGDVEKLEYMKFDKQGSYTIRLVGKHVSFKRWWAPFPKGARLITHDSYFEAKKDPAYGAGFDPMETCAIHILDRNEPKEKQLKILEKGKYSKIFQAFREYVDINNGADPAHSKTGPEFVIKIKYKDQKNKNTADYTVTPKNTPCPLTPEEIAMCKAKLKPLNEIYRATPIEKIIEAWNKLPDSSKIANEENMGKFGKKKKDGDSEKKKEVIDTPLADDGDGEKFEDEMKDSPADKEDAFEEKNETKSTVEDDLF